MTALLTLQLVLVGPALAVDNVGALAPLVALNVNTVDSDTFLQFHGRMIVGDSIGGYAEYRWGGTACGSKTLEEYEVARLQDAMNNPRILVQPLWQAGQGSSQCLVGFWFVLRSETGALP
jgi:hypothetical protein